MSALTQRLASLVTVGVVASLCTAVLLTAGRAEGSATDVLSSLDDSGTRSIVLRAEPGSGLDTGVIERLQGIGGIEWIGAFGAADDVTNAFIAGGAPVASRVYYGAGEGAEGAVGPVAGAVGEGAEAAGARATRLAAEQLGLSDDVGGVVLSRTGEFVGVAGLVELPPDLRFLEPVVLVAARAPRGAAPGGDAGPNQQPPENPVAVLVVRAASPRQVGAVAAAVTSVLGVEDATTVSVQTSERLAAVRQQVENQLGDFGRTLVLTTFGGSAALVGAILFALVMMRRRDFGRRRALGASRSLIVALLLGQVGLTAAAASVLGTGVALVALSATGQPLPTPAFTAAVAILATATSLVAAVLPAVFASLRDPLRELRVP